MVVIKTKFLAPTNHRGSRIQASAIGFKTTIPYSSSNTNRAHYDAVCALVKEHHLDWNISDMVYGSDERGDFYFVFPSSRIGTKINDN